ncbi:MAG: LysR family transcriptional regulator [Firmicutes bacterium]|nr:LysR family transcriptional regulator [Bacillota bacterium]
MEIRVLKYFIEIAKTGSITRASEVLHITQPSLSKQMKLLEAELGQKLFKRGQYKMILTEVGRSFLARAEEIVRLSDLTLSEYTSHNKDIQGELSICFIDRTFSERVAALISDFQQLYPGIKLLIIPRGNLCDEYGQSLKIEFDDRYVVAEVQEPLDFLFLVKSFGALLYCIEPPIELLQYSGLVFRPIVPNKTASLYFVQQDVEEQTPATTAFMDHAERFYRNR